MYIENNFLNIYLGRSNLIESSAGTGKTNLISLLYLRLLFGINIEKNFFNLSLNNILIVTFTDVATLEIKIRILNNIRDLRLSCIKKYPINNIIKDFYIFIKDIPNIVNLLVKYESIIDNISIFTIHSFCKRIIFTNFIESKINYNSIIIDNENNLLYRIVIIFWRKFFGPLHINLIKIISSYWLNPINLFKFLLPIWNLMFFNFNIKNKYLSIEDCYNKIILFIDNFKKLWLLNYENIYDFLISKNKILNLLKLKDLFIEINIWCKNKTIDFYVPYNLKKIGFINLYKISNKINFLNFYDIFVYIDKIFFKIKDLKFFIIFLCIKYIKKKILKIKKKKLYLSFNDLIFKLNKIIINDHNKVLVNWIRNNFPILLIDEFQDTDFLQYNIFRKIYINQRLKLNTKLILIGDPKQSIYTFRGANIFNYIKSKKNIDFLYTLNTNWRSSINFVKSINYLFKRINNPFIFKDIKYLNTNFSLKNNFYLIKNNNICPSINFYVLNNLDKRKWRENLATVCAIKISQLLDYNNNFFIFNKKSKRSILPSDIAILVHTNYEIKLIFNIFKKFNLPINTYLEKSNIFHTHEAKEIFFLLKSILNPESVTLLSSALSTSFFNLDLIYIKNIINNEFLLNKWINNFYFYKNIWDKDGISVMMNSILKVNKNNVFFLEKNKFWLNNILHITEILEKKSYSFKNNFLLIYWLNDNISDVNKEKKDFYIRSLNKNNGIKISTIHKSKGLQYNIVWLPFIINFKVNNFYFIYHNRKNFRLNIDLYKLRKNLFFVNEEIYSEEMRLFYVAITRSIYQCNIFLYELLNNKNKKFCFTCLGRLLSNDSNYNFSKINKIINNNINYKHIYFNFLDYMYLKDKKFIFLKNNNIKKKTKKYKYYINKKYILNFSKIISLKFKRKKKLNIDNLFLINNKKSLPKGKKVGNFFHKILEKINFLDLLDNSNILYYMLKFSISKKWFFCIKRILFNFLNVNLLNNSINILNKKIVYFKEFDFFLPIVNLLNLRKFINIINKYSFVPKIYKNIDFNIDSIKGFLNGIIDLLFIYKNKYFIIDYKSNWLGNSYINYSNKCLYKTIYLYRYDLQYLLYAIALHNYLKLNIKDYNYNINFGGIYYIFLRGLFLDNKNNSVTGIFYTKPNFLLIKKLNYFFKIKV